MRTGKVASRAESGKAVAMTKKTVTHLSDGRELIYFDERDDAVRELRDPRELVPTRTRSEIRYDELLDQWVVIASHRQSRTHLPPADQCPLCPSRDGRQTEVPGEYDVAVFENRFPSLAVDVPDLEPLPGEFIRRPGVGRCEVVCFTSDHDSSFAELTPARARVVIDAWADRTEELGAIPGVEQVFVFENRGEAIGVTLHHPHGQIYAYPFVPPRIRRMYDSARRHQRIHHECLFCRVVQRERAAGIRIVCESEHWTVFVPAAARWPYEAHVYARRHLPELSGLTGDERDDLARVYLDMLRRFDAVFGKPMPYIAAWMQSAATHDRQFAHLHAQVFSIQRAEHKLKYLAGSESAASVWINDVSPEQAAEHLRDGTPA
jgi:UDPglucose--hexose-1-phosphate uridylyltransferase